MNTERRQDPRIDVELSVELRIGDHSIAALAEDVSIGGMCILTGEGAPAVAVGERLETSFRLPDLEEALAVPVEVRWVDRANPRRFGARFTPGLRASQGWAIERLRSAS